MSLARDIAIMRRAAMLRVLSEEQLKLLAFGSERRQLHRGDVLHPAGEPAAGGTLVLFGQLELRTGSDHPADQLAGVGALLDGPAMLIEGTHRYRAVARVETEVLLVARGQMLRILHEFPEIAAKLQSELVAQTEALMGDLETIQERFRPL